MDSKGRMLEFFFFSYVFWDGVESDGKDVGFGTERDGGLVLILFFFS